MKLSRPTGSVIGIRHDFDCYIKRTEIGTIVWGPSELKDSEFNQCFYEYYSVDFAPFFIRFAFGRRSLNLYDLKLIPEMVERIRARNSGNRNRNRSAKKANQSCQDGSIFYFPFPDSSHRIYGPLAFLYFLCNRTDPKRFSFRGIPNLSDEQWFFLKLEYGFSCRSKKVNPPGNPDHLSFNPPLLLQLNEVPQSAKRTIAAIGSSIAAIGSWDASCQYKRPQKYNNIPSPAKNLCNLFFIYTKIPASYGGNEGGGTAGSISRSPQLLTFPAYLDNIRQTRDGAWYLRRNKPLDIVVQYLKFMFSPMRRVFRAIIEDSGGFVKRLVTYFSPKLGFPVTTSFEAYLISFLFFHSEAYGKGPEVCESGKDLTSLKEDLWCHFWYCLSEPLGIMDGYWTFPGQDSLQKFKQKANGKAGQGGHLRKIKFVEKQIALQVEYWLREVVFKCYY